MNDPLYEKRKTREEFQKDKKTQEKQLEEKGINKDKSYLFDTA